MPPPGTPRRRRARWRWPGPSARAAFPRGSVTLLEEAVRERTPVSMRYRSLAGRRTAWRGVDPYKLFHREAAWYLIGRCHLHDEPRVFRLDRNLGRQDRRRALRSAGLRPRRAPPAHVGRLPGDASCTRSPSTSTPRSAPLIERGAHHPGERIEQLGNGRLAYRVTLSHLSEIARWIVGFGGQARAVAPPALVRIVADLGLLAFERHARGDAHSPAPVRRQQDLPGLVREAAARQRSFNYDGPSG